MSVFKLENGEWINDNNGIISYEGEYKVIVDDAIDDCDTMFEILECHGKKLINTQIKIQKKAIDKFKELYHEELDTLSFDRNDRKSVQAWREKIEQYVLKFCKRRKTVIPIVLYMDYMYG